MEPSQEPSWRCPEPSCSTGESFRPDSRGGSRAGTRCRLPRCEARLASDHAIVEGSRSGAAKECGSDDSDESNRDWCGNQIGLAIQAAMTAAPPRTICHNGFLSGVDLRGRRWRLGIVGTSGRGAITQLYGNANCLSVGQRFCSFSAAASVAAPATSVRFGGPLRAVLPAEVHQYVTGAAWTARRSDLADGDDVRPLTAVAPHRRGLPRERGIDLRHKAVWL